MKTVQEDIFNGLQTGAIQVMMHVCNNAAVMGSGIAAAVKKNYPAAYDAYVNYGLHNAGLNLGTISTSRPIINLHAQDGYGYTEIRYLNYEALYVSLTRARDWCEKNSITNVGVPYGMGANRAGGDWNIVCAMIKSAFEYSGITLTIYQYEK